MCVTCPSHRILLNLIALIFEYKLFKDRNRGYQEEGIRTVKEEKKGQDEQKGIRKGEK
jgi:hypothetical protein